MNIIETNTSGEFYSFAESLIERAFPVEERRDAAGQRRNVDHNSLMHCLIGLDDAGKPVGVLTYWDFGQFCYVEHFAMSEEVRNRGLGAEMLSAFMDLTGRPTVLEVELPDTDLARRRIGFYSRAGLSLWEDSPYMQPPYRPSGTGLELRLMATDGLSEHDDFELVREMIHRHVYECDPV